MLDGDDSIRTLAYTHTHTHTLHERWDESHVASSGDDNDDDNDNNTHVCHTVGVGRMSSAHGDRTCFHHLHRWRIHMWPCVVWLPYDSHVKYDMNDECLLRSRVSMRASCVVWLCDRASMFLPIGQQGDVQCNSPGMQQDNR